MGFQMAGHMQQADFDTTDYSQTKSKADTLGAEISW